MTGPLSTACMRLLILMHWKYDALTIWICMVIATLSPTSAFRQYSDPFLFHILLCCSLMLQLFTIISPLTNLHSIPHNDKEKNRIIDFFGEIYKWLFTSVTMHCMYCYKIHLPRLQLIRLLRSVGIAQGINDIAWQPCDWAAYMYTTPCSLKAWLHYTNAITSAYT